MPKVAIYVRLSKEDRNKILKEDDSESIINQQIMLLEYCKNKHWDVYNIYNDEDFSGSDRERPAFNAMIADAKDNKFDIVMCKTQSRFARDMELVEKYLNRLFPLWGIRFIGVVDNADTNNRANRKSRQITSMVDQWMLEDLSDNVRATLASKRRQGLWVGAFTPYGYIKDPTNKNHLIIDEDAAKIVRYIFDMYVSGYGITALARKLNDEHIPNPATYKQQKGLPFKNSHSQCSDIWHTYSVRRIISNQVYIGNTVQGMVENVSYKSSKKRQKPREQWDIVENTHEPIIDLPTWDFAQSLRSQRTRSTKTGQPSIFANKLRCLKCGGSMRKHISNHKDYYICHTTFFAKEKCTGTYVSASVLEREILNQIHLLYEEYIDENEMAKTIHSNNGLSEKVTILSDSIKTLETELEKINARFKNIYYDKIDGIISTEEYAVLTQDCTERKEKLQTTIDRHKTEIQSINQKQQQQNNVYDIIKEYKNIAKLDRVTVNTLIDYIEVGGNKNNRIINIHWNF